MLKENFISLFKQYSCDDELIENLWTNLFSCYSESGRQYHNLTHLDNLLYEIQCVMYVIQDRNTLLFSLFYHDIIYNVQSKTNEEDSADYAATVMQHLGVNESMIEKCRQQILATKHHHSSGDHDTDLFTDADLSILGSEWETYKLYVAQIRKEYIIYPDELYIPGRKNVLHHFLEMKRIYKTDHFFDKYEEKTKANLLKEMDLL